MKMFGIDAVRQPDGSYICSLDGERERDEETMKMHLRAHQMVKELRGGKSWGS